MIQVYLAMTREQQGFTISGKKSVKVQGEKNVNYIRSRLDAEESSLHEGYMKEIASE